MQEVLLEERVEVRVKRLPPRPKTGSYEQRCKDMFETGAVVRHRGVFWPAFVAYIA